MLLLLGQGQMLTGSASLCDKNNLIMKKHFLSCSYASPMQIAYSTAFHFYLESVYQRTSSRL